MTRPGAVVSEKSSIAFRYRRIGPAAVARTGLAIA